MNPSPLISCNELALQLNQPDLRLIDCRFNLTDPEWGKISYMQSHIPGAFFADLNRDLSATPTPSTGRHPLPDPFEFIMKMAAWGIEPASHVVVYDTVGGGFAARLWWMLRAVGHCKVYMLNGGFTRWQEEGNPVETGEIFPVSTKYQYSPKFNCQMMVTTEEVESLLNNPDYRIIDARSAERFAGEVEPIDPIAGHIPGAVNRFHGLNISKEMTLRPVKELKHEFSELLGNVLPDKTIVYCGSGVTSCHHLLAMEAIGLTGARLYVGSWSEWIKDPSRPVQTGREIKP